MDDLTLSLAVLGGIAILAVFAYNSWQVRRAGPKRAAGTAARGEQREPVFDAEPGLAPAPDPDAVDGPVSTAQRLDGVDGDAVLPALPAQRRTPARLDALIDVLVTLHLEHPVTAELVLAHLPASRRAGSKPMTVEGLNLDSGDWEAPAPGAHYTELQAGVQLANRTGALNEIEYSEFIQKLQAFADALGAMVDFPDMLDVVARARELDAFASQHDAQLVVQLRARGAAWSLGYIQQQAALQGFVAGALPGRLVLPGAAEGAPPVLVLGYDPQAALSEDPGQAALRDLSLSFDVPQTEEDAEPFAAWYARAQALAAAMDALIVDDRGQPLGPPAFAAIDAELKRLYAVLAQRDLAAGSLAARRVFS
jgi:hypothetical protein